MPRLIALPLIFLLGSGSISYVDHRAAMTRPTLDLPRAVFCGHLLSQPGWIPWAKYDKRMSSVERALNSDQLRLARQRTQITRSPSPGGLLFQARWPSSRAFVGDVTTLDETSIDLWLAAEDRSRQDLEITGARAIRTHLQQLERLTTSLHRNGDDDEDEATWFKDSRLFRDFENARFAVELAGFDLILKNYAAGRGTKVIAFSLANLNAPSTFSSFLFERGVTPFRLKPDQNYYLWHVLYYDHQRRTPVWRMGLSLQSYL